ncbi:MAG TPA: nickel insertion protein, partial [Chloroflexota bacterium]|nr:nickel insertion protein [Chloroflexota bacterium]
PLRSSTAASELVTPTGAALLATLATFDQPPMTLSRVGYGFGQKIFDWPNVARLWLGDTAELKSGPVDRALEDTIVVIEANLDDETPEIVGATLDLLLDAGALDVFFTPIQMKRNRPAVKLTVLAPIHLAERLGSLVIRETSTLGVRTYQTRRQKALRWQASVMTPWGEVRIKVKEFESQRRAAPEYADCLRIARESDIPLPEVYRAVNAAAAEQGFTSSASVG